MSAQVVAYNKIDLPDSGDYIDEVREFLLGEGVPPEDIFAVSAATGKGVRDLVRRARIVLDALPVVVRPFTLPTMWSRVQNSPRAHLFALAPAFSFCRFATRLQAFPKASLACRWSLPRTSQQRHCKKWSWTIWRSARGVACTCEIAFWDVW